MSGNARLVGGEGPVGAKIALVGEAPGREEEAQRRPFVGAAGKVLNAMLAAAGIKREECYVTNVVKVRPPDNKLERLGELGYKIADFTPELIKELEAIRPRLVLPLGDLACAELTGKRPISKWRGSIVPSVVDGLKAMPTLHPAYVLRDYAMHPVVIWDLKKAKKEAENASPVFTPEMCLDPSLETVAGYLDKCHSRGAVSFDIETYGPRIRCLGLSCGPNDAICIPFKRAGVNRWSQEDEFLIWSRVSQLFTDPSVTKIAQNSQFDIQFLLPHVGFPRPTCFDTLLAHHLLYPELPHDLDFLTSVYTNIGYYGIGNVMKASDEDCWVYNCHDVMATFQVYQALSEELREKGLEAFYYGYTIPLSICLFEMQLRGVRIAQERRSELVNGLQGEADKLLSELAEIAPGLNIRSNPQLVEYLYRQKGYKPLYHRKRHTITVDKGALAKLSAQGSKVAHLTLQTRAREKLVSTFLDIPLAPDGRLHCEYVVSGTVTGRLSSRAPVSGCGTNLQNIPRTSEIGAGVRSVFIPAEGCCFVKGDLSQAENRVVAWLTKGPMKEAFERGDDVHVLTAELVGTTRQVAKVINHASNYGMGPGQLSVLLGCSQPEARRHLERYHNAYPEVRQWHQRIREQLQKNRTLVTPLGRIRKFLGKWDDSLFRSAYAHIPQSTVGDYLNMGLVELWLRLKGLPAYPVLQVHDEIVVECELGYEEEVAQLMKTSVEKPISIEGDELTIPLETTTKYESWLS